MARPYFLPMRNTSVAVFSLVSLVTLGTASASKPYERRVYPEEVAVSSVLANQTSHFRATDHANYALDDDASTVWTEGQDGSGSGAKLSLRLALQDDATRLRLRVRTGCQTSAEDFAASPRPKTATLTISPGNARQEVTFKDDAGWQEIILEQPAGKFESVELTVGSVYEGKANTDLCIADVQMFVTATSDDHAYDEKWKADRLRYWKEQRAQAARAFAAAGDDVPMLPNYSFETAEGEGLIDSDRYEACKYAALCTFAELLAAGSRDAYLDARYKPAVELARRALGKGVTLAPVSLAHGDQRAVPDIEGFHAEELSFEIGVGDYGSNGLELPNADGLGAFSLSGLDARPIRSKVVLNDVIGEKHRARGCGTRAGATFAWAVRDKQADAAGLHAFVIGRCGLISARDGEYREGDLQILVYGADGRLSVVASIGGISTYEWAQDGDRQVIVAGKTLGSMGTRGTLRANRVPAKPGLARAP